MIRYHLEMGNGKVTATMAAREVAKQVYAKYYHDTVFCVSLSTIQRKVERIWKQFSEGRKRYGQTGKEDSLAVKQYKELFHTKSELFDVFAHDPLRRQSLEKEWCVSMSEMEHKYYEDQKTERRMFCSKGVDPVWYHSMMRTQRLRERSEEYQRKRDQQFSYQTLDHITDILIETGEISSCSSDEEKEGTPPNQLRQMSETDTQLRG
ncbi:hypothetical protein PBY51_007198 [Eleginops maclovinus]|nr:hypothetical protein PBY51_007198 [Eleginops maclovinus]